MLAEYGSYEAKRRAKLAKRVKSETELRTVNRLGGSTLSVIIPSKIVQYLEIRQGDRLRFKVQGNKMILEME